MEHEIIGGKNPLPIQGTFCAGTPSPLFISPLARGEILMRHFLGFYGEIFLNNRNASLDVQFLTARENTERPVTVDVGTNQLIGTNWKAILEISQDRLNGKIKTGTVPDLLDGVAIERIATIMLTKFN
jgi:hypothetical protein